MCLLVGIGIIGCSATQYNYKIDRVSETSAREIYIRIDKNFTESERLRIMEAIDHWNICLNGQITITVKSWDFDMNVDEIRETIHDRSWMFLRINSSNPMVHDDPNGVPPRFTLAFGDDIGGNRVYVVNDRIWDGNLTQIMQHEIGHLLGAKHTFGLMSVFYDRERYKCIDKEVILQVKSYNNLSDNLNYCEKDISGNYTIVKLNKRN